LRGGWAPSTSCSLGPRRARRFRGRPKARVARGRVDLPCTHRWCHRPPARSCTSGTGHTPWLEAGGAGLIRGSHAQRGAPKGQRAVGRGRRAPAPAARSQPNGPDAGRDPLIGSISACIYFPRRVSRAPASPAGEQRPVVQHQVGVALRAVQCTGLKTLLPCLRASPRADRGPLRTMVVG
jgi:hypothetical protein